MRRRISTRRHPPRTLLSAGLSLGLIGAQTAPHADPIQWIGGDGFWYVAGNWSTGNVPTSTDQVLNTSTQSYGSIHLDDGSSQAALTLTNYGEIDVSSGILDVASDVFNTNSFTTPAMIQAHGANSTITLNSAGGSLTNSGILQAYDSGTLAINTSGTLTNQVGAIIATDYSAPTNGGALSFNGTGSLDNAGFIGSTAIGSGGYVYGTLSGAFTNESTGTLVLDSGSNLTLGSTAVISSNAGTITIANGSTLTLNANTFTNSSVIDVSNGGNVLINIGNRFFNSAGATLATDYTGPANGSVITLSGVNLDNAGFIGSKTLGSGGSLTGTLTGTFTNESTGTLVLDSYSNLTAGNFGSASSNAGTITVTDSHLTNNSVLTINAPTFTNSGMIDTSNEGQVNINVATQLINQAGAVMATDYTSATNGGRFSLNGSGGLDNAGFIGSTVIGSDGAILGNLAGNFTNESTGTLALDSGSNLTLGGTGSTALNAGSITVANSSQLTLNAPTFTNTGTLAATQQGTLTLNGATTLAGGKVLVDSVSTIVATGALTQTGGTTQVDGALQTASALQLQGGDLVGTGTVTGNINNTGGTLRPGAVLGTLTVNGNYTQGAGGKMEIDLGGLQPGVSSDLLTVTGQVMLGGELDIKAVNGFAPTVGETFNFLTYGGRSGSFASIVDLDDPNDAYVVAYNDTTGIGTLTFAAVPEGSTLWTTALMLAGGAVVLRRQRYGTSRQTAS